MKRIAIVDDQAPARRVVSSVVRDALSNEDLEAEWDVIETHPLVDLESYDSFITDNDVVIMLVDERLGDLADTTVLNTPVSYKGSDLAGYLRKGYPQMPIYGVTAYPSDDTLETHFSEFDEVIERSVFTRKAASYVPRFIRMYQNFLKAKSDLISELSDLSKKVANGSATSQDEARISEIQEKINITTDKAKIKNRREWLEEYSTLLDRYEEIQREAREHLNSRGE